MTALQLWPLLLLIYSNESVILGAKKNCDIINDAPRSKLRGIKEVKKTILYWKGTRCFPFQTYPFLVFTPQQSSEEFFRLKIVWICHVIYN